MIGDEYVCTLLRSEIAVYDAAGQADVAQALRLFATRLRQRSSQLAPQRPPTPRPAALEAPATAAQPGAAPRLYGEALRQWRRSHGLTQADLADLIGVSQTAIGKWERGRAVPRRRHAAALRQLRSSLGEPS